MMSTNDVYSTPSASLAGADGGQGEQLTAGIFEALAKTKFWVLLFGVLMFLGAAVMVLSGLGMMIGGATMGSEFADAGLGGASMAAIGAVYLAVSVVYILLGVYLVQYGSRIGRAVHSRAAADVESALLAQRSFWRTSGIIALVGTVLMVFGIGAAIVIPMLAG